MGLVRATWRPGVRTDQPLRDLDRISPGCVGLTDHSGTLDTLPASSPRQLIPYRRIAGIQPADLAIRYLAVRKTRIPVMISPP